MNRASPFQVLPQYVEFGVPGTGVKARKPLLDDLVATLKTDDSLVVRSPAALSSMVGPRSERTPRVFP